MSETLKVKYNDKLIKLHPEYYYNINRFIKQSDGELEVVQKATLPFIAATIAAAAIFGAAGALSFSTLFIFEQPHSLTNYAKFTSLFLGATITIAPLVDYCDSHEESFFQYFNKESDQFIAAYHDVYDSAVFLGEYLLDSTQGEL